jgi:hypothetical protein
LSFCAGKENPSISAKRHDRGLAFGVQRFFLHVRKQLVEFEKVYIIPLVMSNHQCLPDGPGDVVYPETLENANSELAPT